MRVLPAALVLALAVASPSAQDPPQPAAPTWTTEEALAQLAGDEPAHVAWAAHLLGLAKLREAIPALRAALPRVAAMANGHLVRLHVLDALVQLDAELPAGELLPHAVGDSRVPALLLAARQPAANRRYFEERMDALAGAEDLEWRVCGNLLAARPQPGFAAHCLAQMQFVFVIRVEEGAPWDPWMRRGSAPSSCSGSHCSWPEPAPAAPPAGFPPPVRHVLDPDNATCRTPSGFACIAWRRESGLPGEIPGCDPQRAWRYWLGACGGERTRAACADVELEITHRWKGLAGLREVVRDEQRRRERMFAAMVAELAKSGELTDAEAGRAQHHFVLELVDARAKPQRPLPTRAELVLPAH